MRLFVTALLLVLGCAANSPLEDSRLIPSTIVAPSDSAEFRRQLADGMAFAIVAFCHPPREDMWLENPDEARASVPLTDNLGALVAVPPGSYRLSSFSTPDDTPYSHLEAGTNTFFGPCPQLSEAVRRDYIEPLVRLPMRFSRK